MTSWPDVLSLLFENDVPDDLPVRVSKDRIPSTKFVSPSFYVQVCRRPPGFLREVWGHGETKTVHDLLQAIRTPFKHRSEHFLTKEYVLHIRDLSWL